MKTVKQQETLKRVQGDKLLKARETEELRGLKNEKDLADLRTDGVPKAQIRIANRLSRLSRKAFRRNSVSVEQIQDTSYRPNVLTSSKVAFTLAETLITLAIIGVVAAITIPSLVKNYNEKAWSTAKDVFEKRLEVATRQMNTEEKLAGYSSTMDFVNELKNKIKITKICDSNELTKCFENTILTEDPKEIDITSLSTSENFTKDNWGTETVGVQFANGVNALIAYNPNTEQDPFNNQFSATAASMAILYDVSGHKNPNTIGKDINQNANVKKLGCMIKKDLVGGMCISQILIKHIAAAIQVIIGRAQ